MTSTRERVFAALSRFYAIVTGRGFAGRNSFRRTGAAFAAVGIVAAVASGSLLQYTVRPGDSLSAIAQSKCHDASDWTGIYDASEKTIGSNPDMIQPGQKLAVHCGRDAKVLSAYDRAHAAPRQAPQQPRAAAAAAAYTPASGDSDGPAPAPAKADPAPVQVASAPVQAGCYDPSGHLSDSQVEMVWECAGGPSWAASAAVAVTWCESGHNTNAYNPSGASGLFQILGSVVAGSLFDAHVNALNAVSKFTASGDSWAQWVCQP